MYLASVLAFLHHFLKSHLQYYFDVLNRHTEILANKASPVHEISPLQRVPETFISEIKYFRFCFLQSRVHSVRCPIYCTSQIETSAPLPRGNPWDKTSFKCQNFIQMHHHRPILGDQIPPLPGNQSKAIFFNCCSFQMLLDSSLKKITNNLTCFLFSRWFCLHNLKDSFYSM